MWSLQTFLWFRDFFKAESADVCEGFADGIFWLVYDCRSPKPIVILFEVRIWLKKPDKIKYQKYNGVIILNLLGNVNRKLGGAGCFTFSYA